MPRALWIFLANLPAAFTWGYCNDKDLSCPSWAKQGECSKAHVKELCPHSCSVCDHNCRDSDEQCPQWGDGGECETAVDFMFKSCPATCGVCKTRCYDKDVDCTAWAREGFCAKNPSLYTLCPVSCGTCTDMCLDKQNDCPNWAAEGQCGTNPGYMLQNCPHSCQVCNELSHTKSKHPVALGETTADGRNVTERVACADHDRRQCLIWGQHECELNPAAVMRQCAHMCGVCTTACEDKYSDCPQWAKEGTKSLFGRGGSKCDDDKAFMLPNCPFSCGICPKLHVFPPAGKDEM